jgi:hypothetical protein
MFEWNREPYTVVNYTEAKYPRNLKAVIGVRSGNPTKLRLRSAFVIEPIVRFGPIRLEYIVEHGFECLIHPATVRRTTNIPSLSILTGMA